MSLIDDKKIIKVKTKKLQDIINFYYGLKTADDKKFLTFEPKNTNEYKKLLRRSDFSRYMTKYKGEYVWYRPDLMRKHKTTARPGEPQRFESLKIIITDIAKKIIATLDNNNYYVKDALGNNEFHTFNVSAWAEGNSLESDLSNTLNLTTVDTTSFSFVNRYVDGELTTGDNDGISWINGLRTSSSIVWGSIQPGYIIYISGSTV